MAFCPLGSTLGSGPLQRHRAAADVVHQNVTAETDQYEDHTFSGIMFDIKTNKLPLEYIEVSSIWVRGDLGPITVWSTEQSYKGKNTKKEFWSCHYHGTHNASMSELKEMRLESPIYIQPDNSVGIYVHSSQPGDDAIVYDNQRHDESHKDLYITITPGMAHLSNDAFSNHMPEGFWYGRPWRPQREFVGRISYGVRWLLWNPDVHAEMPPTFRKIAWSLLLSQTEKAHSRGCRLSSCDLDTILFILNKVEWWEMAVCRLELDGSLRALKRSRDDKGELLDGPRRRIHASGRVACSVVATGGEDYSSSEEYDYEVSGDSSEVSDFSEVDEDEDEDEDEEDEDEDEN